MVNHDEILYTYLSELKGMKSMYQIIVCEDDEKQLEEIKMLIKHILVEEVSICCYSNGNELMENINSFLPSCIFLLDIMLKDSNGIEIAKSINVLKPKASVIFITAFIDKVTDIYAVNHCYFVLKTDIQNRLRFALQKAIHQQDQNRELISIQQNRIKIVVHTEDILYVERDLRVTYIVTEESVEKTTLKIDGLQKQLPSHFQRCHNSYIVNLKKILRLSRNEVILKNKHTIPVSRAYSKIMEEAFNEYILELV